MYRTNIITHHVILLIDAYILTVFLSYIFQILEYYLSVLLSCMCETQMKGERGRVRIMGGGVRCYCLCIDTDLASILNRGHVGCGHSRRSAMLEIVLKIWHTS